MALKVLYVYKWITLYQLYLNILQNSIWIRSRWMTLRHTKTSSAKTKWRSSTCTCFISPIFTLKLCSFVKWVANYSLIFHYTLFVVYVTWFVSISFCWLNLILPYHYWSFLYYWTDLPLWFIEASKRIRFSQIKNKENPRQN